jgi:hypothetical protein
VRATRARSLESAQVDGDLHGAVDLATNAISIGVNSAVGVDEAGATSGDGGAVSGGVVLGADLHAGDGQASTLGDDGRSIVARPALVALVLEVPLGPGAGDGAVRGLLDSALAGALEASTATLGVLVEGDVLHTASRQGESGRVGTEEAIDATVGANLVPDHAVQVLGGTEELGSVVVLVGELSVGQQDLVAAVVGLGAGVTGILDLVEGGTLLGSLANIGKAGEGGDTLAGGGRRGGGSGLGGRRGRGGGGGGRDGSRRGGSRGGGGGGNLHVSDGIGGLVGDDGGSGRRAVVLGLHPGDSDTVNDGVDGVTNGALLVLRAVLVVETSVARRVGRGAESAEQEEGCCETGHFELLIPGF